MQFKFIQLITICSLVFGSVSVLHLLCYQYCLNYVRLNSSSVLLNFQTKNIHNEHNLYTGIGEGHTVFTFHLTIVLDYRATWATSKNEKNKNNPLLKNFLYVLKKKFFLYFGKLNFPALILKTFSYFLKKAFLKF